MTTILVSGVIANKYLQGGAVWTRLSWILGLRNLGFDVHFVEQISANTCVNASGKVVPFTDSANLAWFRRIMNQFGLADSATLVLGDGEQTAGLSVPELQDLAASSALLVNITGHLKLQALLDRIPCKAYIDLDPGYVQTWHVEGSAERHLLEHDFHFSVGENIGLPGCTIPTGGIAWRPIRQPIVLDQWPATLSSTQGRFTTIANWRGPYAPITIEGQTYGSKVHEFRKYITLPRLVSSSFELALDIHPAEQRDLELLAAHGWQVIDPRLTLPDPDAFRRYVQGSGAEFSVAQAVYVHTGSGWFSDRTVRYLASGKPVLVQDTGFSHNIPTGAGLLAFRTLDEAARLARHIIDEYPAHCAAARALAESHFESRKVLEPFLDVVGVYP
jgi:hypothetical protein